MNSDFWYPPQPDPHGKFIFAEVTLLCNLKLVVPHHAKTCLRVYTKSEGPAEAFALSDQGLHCLLTDLLDTTECLNGPKGPDDILRRIVWMRVLRMFEGSFSLVLRFYGPVHPMELCRARSVYLTTLLLHRFSPLSDQPVLCTFFSQKLTTAFLGREWP